MCNVHLRFCEICILVPDKVPVFRTWGTPKLPLIYDTILVAMSRARVVVP